MPAPDEGLERLVELADKNPWQFQAHQRRRSVATAVVQHSKWGGGPLGGGLLGFVTQVIHLWMNRLGLMKFFSKQPKLIAAPRKIVGVPGRWEDMDNLLKGGGIEKPRRGERIEAEEDVCDFGQFIVAIFAEEGVSFERVSHEESALPVEEKVRRVLERLAAEAADLCASSSPELTGQRQAHRLPQIFQAMLPALEQSVGLALRGEHGAAAPGFADSLARLGWAVALDVNAFAGWKEKLLAAKLLLVCRYTLRTETVEEKRAESLKALLWLSSSSQAQEALRYKVERGLRARLLRMQMQAAPGNGERVDEVLGALARVNYATAVHLGVKGKVFLVEEQEIVSWACVRSTWRDSTRLLEASTRRWTLYDALRNLPVLPDGWGGLEDIQGQHVFPSMMRGHADEVLSLAVDPRGKRLYSVSEDRELRVWRVGTLQAEAALALVHHKSDILRVLVDEQGRRLFLSSGRDILVWTLDPLQHTHTCAGHKSDIRAIAFDAAHNRLFSSGHDCMVKVWCTGPESEECYQCVCTLEGQEETVISMALHPQGHTLFVGDLDGLITVWDVRPGADMHQTATLRGHDDWVTALLVDARNNSLLSGSLDSTIRIWDLHDHACRHVVRDHERYVNSLAIDDDRGLLFSGSSDGTVRVWDAGKLSETGGGCLHVLTHSKGCGPLTVRGHLFSAGPSKTILMWDV